MSSLDAVGVSCPAPSVGLERCVCEVGSFSFLSVDALQVFMHIQKAVTP
jgi:hypothetical protein